MWRRTNLSAVESMRLLHAGQDFMQTNGVFEQPIRHSPNDHVQELERARHTIRLSAALGKGPVLLEVARPIREFADTAMWVINIAYHDVNVPDGVSFGSLTIYREQSPGSMGMPDDDNQLFRSVMADLSPVEA